jgi:hypothetical protein
LAAIDVTTTWIVEPGGVEQLPGGVAERIALVELLDGVSAVFTALTEVFANVALAGKA